MMQKLNFFSDDFIYNEIGGESDYIKCPDRPLNTILNSPNKNNITQNKKFIKRSFCFFKRIKRHLYFVVKLLTIFLLINGGI